MTDQNERVVTVDKATNVLREIEQAFGRGFERAAQEHGERLTFAVGIQALPTGKTDPETDAHELTTVLAVYVCLTGAEEQTIVSSTGMLELAERGQEDYDRIAESMVANILTARAGQAVARAAQEAESKAQGAAQPMSGLLSANGQPVAPDDTSDDMRTIIEHAEGR